MTDKYDNAIAYLTEHPEEIEYIWGEAPCRSSLDEVRGVDGAECLFAVTAPGCGCLTQIRGSSDGVGAGRAPTPELTAAIRADHRIPKREEYITVEDLPVFAEWQRKIDAFHRGEA